MEELCKLPILTSFPFSVFDSKSVHYLIWFVFNSYVGKFLSKHDRSGNGSEQAVKKFTNVYVKNLSDTVDDKKLNEMFAKFGEITSAKVSLDKEGKSLCFGFVNFKNPDEAAQVR